MSKSNPPALARGIRAFPDPCPDPAMAAVAAPAPTVMTYESTSNPLKQDEYHYFKALDKNKPMEVPPEQILPVYTELLRWSL